MNFETVVFYFFAAILLFAAFRVVTTRNPVHAALYLVLAFFTSAGLWLMLEAEFLAIALVLVYVGAVMVLFLFVVMMLDINLDRLREGFWDYLPLAGFVATMLVIEMTVVLGSRSFGLDIVPSPVPHAAGYSNTKELGSLLYTDYVYPFELAAVVLLVAIVAAIALTMRRRKNSKYQDPAQQVRIKRADRVRIVAMASEQPSSTKS
ncbi:NADH-quinone oxidoreductase subunit J [Sulfuriferula thiophila]|uniref:NADH-quinone oxidoreductase subunit J n=1 Tax=Sulfuriferula thiophila TaxID=1781211 RepID=UPI000F60EA6F|nr:NADH-quinone oxidoreductase subunit J [Sulfuriferula thiophila]